MSITAQTQRGMKERRSIPALIAAARQQAQGSDRIFHTPLEPMDLGGGLTHTLPRFLFVGPGAGAAYLRLGIFAGLHGDETAGCHATLAFLALLDEEPELARGYELFLYPVCNPSGYEDGTRFNRRGADLNREFWKNSHHPEVRVLEDQLRGLRFDGIISLHSDDTSEGVYGFVRGASLTRDVLAPALSAAEAHLPRNNDAIIDGFRAANGIIHEGYHGVLSSPPETRPVPFEIVLETPQLAPIDQQIHAHVAALRSVLETYRSFISYGQNL